jgi:hypothetical protein
MINNIALLLSGLGIGGLLGVFAKSMLDKRQFKFTKVLDYKERRYQAIVILLLAAANPTKYDLLQLKLRRPEITDLDDLDRELELEYYNAMIFASDSVLEAIKAFLVDKSMANYEAAARAMRRDLYL